ncbi:restriction endonuclease subunit S [Cohnella sp.]|uniref:restriction endonuclease subunit S n=1 Tax=Cohnella sp. TaxID=1883426 RepID=UPI0035626B94
MSKVKLSEITSIITKGTTPTTIGFSFQEQGINFLKVESIAESGEFLSNKFQYISDECNMKLKRSILMENDILFSIAGALGRTAIVKKEILPANTNQALAIIRLSNEESYTKYIHYALKSVSIFKQFQKQQQGVAQLNLSLKNIGELEIPHPPLEIQKQIAKTLDTATELLAMRKQQLAELDNLIKSTFYDMFGDPIKNERVWECLSIEKTIKVIEAGWSVDGIKKIKGKDDKAVLKVSAVTSGFFRETEYKVLDKDLNIKKYVFPHKNDLLFSRANTKELVGATCIIFEDYPDLLLPDKLWRIEFNSLANVIYMKYVLSDKSIRSSLSNNSTGTSGSMYNISMGKLKSTIVPLPPLALQNQFAEIVTKIEEQKTLVKKAIDETQYLFDSLMSEYFD